MRTTYRELIQVELMRHGETWADIEILSTKGDVEKKVDTGFGSEEGPPFTAWTSTRVLFPVCYDGSEWVSSVPRHPCDVATTHQGG